MTRYDYDVVVVGGGAAGLSGAIALLRSRRRVLVVDAGRPRNAPAAGVHNLLTRDGLPPGELVALGREEVRRYGGEVREGRAVSAARLGDGFEVDLDGGDRLTARRLLVTSGLVDELPEVDGLRERWGHQVLHCPYCHGWEVRDQRIGVLATGPAAVHQALLFSQLSDDVVVLAHTAPPAPEDRARLAAAGVRVQEGEVVALEGPAHTLESARLADGRSVPLDAVVVAPRMLARSAVLDALGLAPEAHPSGLGEQYPSGPAGRTEAPGVWVAGNVADVGAQVMAAAAAGTLAGAAINLELIEADLMERVA
jgi:thioredoxin reductase